MRLSTQRQGIGLLSQIEQDVLDEGKSLGAAEFTMIALRRAAQRGRLDAVQGPDGIWRSCRKAVDAYRAAKHQRRPENTAPSE
jgi:hypothetical protein